jgi:pimeloyl-ACP methyl ester carboxylesterase
MKWFRIGAVMLAAVLLLSIAVYYNFPEPIYNHSITTERDKAGLKVKELSVDDHKIKYLERSAPGETLVLLHGFGVDKDTWPRMASFIPGYHLVIPDIPGFGESTKSASSSYDIASQAERLDKFFTLLGLKKFFIAGNSMGGNISGIYSIKYPDKVKGLILLNNSGVVSPVKSAVMQMFEKGENPLLMKENEDFYKILDLLFVKEQFMPYPIKRMLAERAVKNREFNEKIFKDMMNKPAMFEGQFAKLTMPVLIIWGDKDKFIDVSAVTVLEKGIKNHTTKILKDCGHVPMVERPEETASFIKKFIEDNK